MIRSFVLAAFVVSLLASFAAPPDKALAQQGGQCPSNLALQLSVPPEGPANVTATIFPQVPLAAPEQGSAGTYFIAWVADGDAATALPAGQRVRADYPRVTLSANTTQNFDHLGGSRHTVTAVLIGSDGLPCIPMVSGAIAFLLQGPNPPPTGTGAAQESGRSLPALALLGFALIATSTVVVVLSTRRHRRCG